MRVLGIGPPGVMGGWRVPPVASAPTPYAVGAARALDAWTNRAPGVSPGRTAGARGWAVRAERPRRLARTALRGRSAAGRHGVVLGAAHADLGAEQLGEARTLAVGHRPERLGLRDGDGREEPAGASVPPPVLAHQEL